MTSSIVHKFAVPPLPIENDVAKREVDWTLDGAAQTPIEVAPSAKPVDIEVSMRAGQKFAGFIKDTSAAGVVSDFGDTLEFTAVDDVKPEKPGKLQLVGKAKKFLATGPHS